jgi:hypothetical protein
MKNELTPEKIREIYLDLVLINFNLDDPYYYCNEDTKKDLDKVLRKFEEVYNDKKEDEQ